MNKREYVIKASRNGFTHRAAIFCVPGQCYQSYISRCAELYRAKGLDVEVYSWNGHSWLKEDV